MKTELENLLWDIQRCSPQTANTAQRQIKFVNAASRILEEAADQEQIKRIGIYSLSQPLCDLYCDIVLPKFLVLNERYPESGASERAVKYAENFFFRLLKPFNKTPEALMSPALYQETYGVRLEMVALSETERFCSQKKFNLEFNSAGFDKSLDMMVDLLFMHAQLNDELCDEVVGEFLVAIKDMQIPYMYDALAKFVGTIRDKDSKVYFQLDESSAFKRTSLILETAFNHKESMPLIQLILLNLDWDSEELYLLDRLACKNEQELFISRAAGNEYIAQPDLMSDFEENLLRADRATTAEDRMRMSMSKNNRFVRREVVVCMHDLPREDGHYSAYYGVVLEKGLDAEGERYYTVGCGYDKLSGKSSHTFSAEAYQLGKINKRVPFGANRVSSLP